MLNLPDKIIIHHTADSSNLEQFDKVNNWHKTQQFPRSSLGYYCGYHAFIERNGKTTFARMYDEIGAHTLGENRESVGICLAGNFDVEQPTEAQKNQLTQICMSLMTFYKIPINRIYGHRDFRQTSCPGKNINIKKIQFAIIQQKINILRKIILWLKITLQK